MSDQVKDFQYYADKAEQAMRSSRSGKGLDGAKLELERAKVYAMLAAAAPAVQTVPCPARLSAYGPQGYSAAARSCVLQNGHEGDHTTADGVQFHN